MLALQRLELMELELCRHHWKMDTPSGPTSNGCCKLCGQWRTFLNHYEDTVQDGNSVFYPRARRLTLMEPIGKVNSGYEW